MFKHKYKNFQAPHPTVKKELKNDHKCDYWENCKQKREPVIGILTQPVADVRKEIFNFDQYILGVNYDFIRWSGSKPIAIPYNIKDQEL